MENNIQLKQFVPQEFCLKCDVCCRFSQPDTIWAPFFAASEISNLVENDILPPLVFTSHPPDSKKTGAQRINLTEIKDHYICPCFNPPDQKCKIYPHRPFECQLYPFLLTRKEGRFYVSQDNECPYFKIGPADKIKKHIDYLRQEFRSKEIIAFLKQNQELFVEYPPFDLEVLFPVNL
jgi:Fe-S-cluster containining protein